MKQKISNINEDDQEENQMTSQRERINKQNEYQKNDYKKCQ